MMLRCNVGVELLGTDEQSSPDGCCPGQACKGHFKSRTSMPFEVRSDQSSRIVVRTAGSMRTPQD